MFNLSENIEAFLYQHSTTVTVSGRKSVYHLLMALYVYLIAYLR
jgi:hypothetical protein